MNKYIVMQGNMTKSGCGDFWQIGAFDTLEEAQKEMNSMFDNINGITKYNGGYLETTIEFDGEQVDGMKFRY